MEVKLLTMTDDPFKVMSTAARTCYSKYSPIKLWEDDIDNETFVFKVLSSGHLSIAEHINFTFAIEGISRACANQLTRHRHCTFSQQSQRYVNMEGAKYVVPKELNDIEAIEFSYKVDGLIKKYIDMVDRGFKQEDARAILPNCLCTNVTMTVNLRQLIHMCGLRLCTRAQAEIRELFRAIVLEVKNKDKRIGNLLVPQCENLGYCPETKCCGRKAKKNVGK